MSLASITSAVPRFAVPRWLTGYRTLSALLLGLYIVLALVKSQPLLPDGRFWAEEGLYFFTPLHDRSLSEALTFVEPKYRQYFLLLNLLPWAAGQVPFEYAPLVTSIGALLIQTMIVGVVISGRRQLGLPVLYTAVFIVAAVTIPQSHETWATSTNLHWHFQLLLVVLLLVKPASRWLAGVQAAAVVIAGLTSFSVVFLLPLYGLKALLERTRWSSVLLLCAALPALMQVLVFFSTPPDDRSFSLSYLLSLPWTVSAQMLVGPAFGIGAGEALAQLIGQSAARMQPGDLPLLAGMIAVLISMVVFLLRSGDRRIDWLLGGIAVLLIGNQLGSLDPPIISVLGAGRYFFAPSLLLLIALGITAHKPRLLNAYFVLVVVTGLLTGGTLLLTGSNWRAALAEARIQRLPVITIWPGLPFTVPNTELLQANEITPSGS